MRMGFLTNREPVDGDPRNGFGETRHRDARHLTAGTADVPLPEGDAARFGMAPRGRRLPVAQKVSDPANAPGWMALRTRLEKTLARGGDVVVYIHGFDTSFDDAMWYGAQIERAYSERLDALRARPPAPEMRIPSELKVVVFTWPAPTRTFLRPLYALFRGYRAGTKEASQRSFHGVTELLRLLEPLTASRGSARPGRLHLMCQSMGVLIFRHALEEYLKERTSEIPPLFDTVSLTGSDEDSDSFEKDAGLKRLPELCRKVTVYHNPNDILGRLAQASRACNPEGVRKRMSRHGVLHPDKAPNVDTVDVSCAVGRARAFTPQDMWGHYYARINREVIDDIARVMTGATWTAGASNALPGRKLDQAPNDYRLVSRSTPS
jgi:esterase/lipase superfamily enzyme